MKKLLFFAMGLFTCLTSYANEPLTGQTLKTDAQWVQVEPTGDDGEPLDLKKDEVKGFYSVFLRSSLENEAYKYGGNVDMEGTVIIKNGFGVDFSFGWGILWDPKFDMTNALCGLGPCYGVKLAPACELYVPAKVMCSIYYGENDKTKTNWGVRISPTILLGKGRCKFAIGAFCDMFKETSFGLTLGISSLLD